MGFFDFFKRKKNTQELNTDVTAIEETAPISYKEKEIGLAILLEQLPATFSLDESSLIEIKDPNVLARIDSLVPSASTTGATIGNLIKNFKGKQAPQLYRVDLKNLVDSKEIKGAKRAFSMDANGIHKNANLIPVDQTLDKGAVVANAGAAVMGVASMVVGQYYMQQVDTQLAVISDHISKVIDFLDIQYKRDVASLIESVYNISKFRMSSIENEELRGRELDTIQIKRDECQKLLNQAEITLETLTSKNCPDYDDYERTVKEIGKWSQYQTVLVKLLYQINILDFTLHLGIKSKEHCFGSFTLHTSKLESIHDKLVGWHNTQCEVLKIDLEENRRKHTGFLALLEKPISWLHDEWNYKAVGGQTVKMIKSQTSEIATITYSDDNLFDEDVQIIAKDGKYYYLPADNS